MLPLVKTTSQVEDGSVSFRMDKEEFMEVMDESVVDAMQETESEEKKIEKNTNKHGLEKQNRWESRVSNKCLIVN